MLAPSSSSSLCMPAEIAEFKTNETGKLRTCIGSEKR